VNVGKVEKVAPLFSGNFEITLKDPKRTKIPLSRRYTKNLKTLLGGW
jgi:DNA-binding LytR/AlgR family response regulator